MAIDPSIPLGITPYQNQYNPLAAIGEFAKTGNALIGMQANQLAIAKSRALQSAYQGTPLDPKTGLPDTNALIQNLRTTPNGGLAIPEVINQTQNQQKVQYELQKAAQDQATSRAGIFSTALAPLLAKGDNIGTGDVTGVLARLHAAGVPIDGAVNQVVSTMPTTGGAPLRQWVLQNFGAALPAADQASTFLPKVGTQDTGGQVQTYDANPVTDPNATGMTFNKTLSPGEQITPVDGPLNAQGGQTKMPAATFATSQGLGGLVPGGASSFGSGRPSGLPAALLNPNNPGNAPGAPGAATPPGSDFGTAGGDPAAAPGTDGQPPAPMTTGLGPGQQSGLDTAGKASADQWASLQSQVGGTAAGGGSAGRIFQLQKSLGLLQQLGSQGTGPSSPQTQAVASYLQSLPGIGSIVPGIDPSKIRNYDEANKYLTAYASARAGAHGGTTDSQLATTLSSNASTHISNLAAQDVVKANIGLERMDQAQAQAFQSTTDPTTGRPLTPDQFSNFSATWNKTMDPRAFIADQLSPTQVTSLVSSMSPSDQAKFQNTYNTAITNGWMDPPAWTQQPAPGQGAAAGAAPAPVDAGPSTADIAINPGGQ